MNFRLMYKLIRFYVKLPIKNRVKHIFLIIRIVCKMIRLRKEIKKALNDIADALDLWR